MKDVVVIYHGACSDGFGGAWAAHKKMGERATYFGAVHQEPPPAGLKDKVIFFIDFIYKKEVLEKIIKDNKAVIALDHHATAQKELALVDDYVFDNKHSGAAIAWKYFHSDKPLPYLLRVIEDYDLWNFKVPHTKEIGEVIDLAGYDFKRWDKLAKDLESAAGRKEYVKKGKLLSQYLDIQLNDLAILSPYLVKFEGHKILAANVQHFFSSPLGPRLYGKRPPFCLMWCQMGNKIKVSLRSDGSFDVSKLAVKYGGGGHKAAAGFCFPINKKFPWENLKR